MWRILFFGQLEHVFVPLYKYFLHEINKIMPAAETIFRNYKHENFLSHF